MAGLDNSKVAVLYHYPCPDGIFGALAAHIYHAVTGVQVQFFPNRVYKPDKLEKYDLKQLNNVYLVDFAGPPGFAEDLATRTSCVTVLDHHKTALEALPAAGTGPENLHCQLDMSRSGATIALDYFSSLLAKQQAHLEPVRSSQAASTKGNAEHMVGDVASLRMRFLATHGGQRVEILFRYIEDGDLWKWQLPESKAFSSGLADLCLDYDASLNPSIFEQLLALEASDIIFKGRKSLAIKQEKIDRFISAAFPLCLGGCGSGLGSCLAVSDDEAAPFRSELGNQLAEHSKSQGLRAIGAIIYVEPGMVDASVVKVSLRSVGPEEDTTIIAKTYGGGGHRKASSFLLNRNELSSWMEGTA